jgi:hypothetical protein
MNEKKTKTDVPEAKEPMFLDRNAILQANDIEYRVVSVPEWPNQDGSPGKVRIKSMTAGERDEIENMFRRAKVTDDSGTEYETIDVRQVKALGCVLTICNERGKRIFRREDIQLLSSKSGKAVDRIWNESAKLSGISEEEDKEAAKN